MKCTHAYGVIAPSCSCFAVQDLLPDERDERRVVQVVIGHVAVGDDLERSPSGRDDQLEVAGIVAVHLGIATCQLFHEGVDHNFGGTEYPLLPCRLSGPT